VDPKEVITLRKTRIPKRRGGYSSTVGGSDERPMVGVVRILLGRVSLVRIQKKGDREVEGWERSGVEEEGLLLAGQIGPSAFYQDGYSASSHALITCRAPTFVSTSSKPATPPTQLGEAEPEVEEVDEDGSEEEDESDTASPVPASPRVREPENDDDEAPQRGMGLGFRNGFAREGAPPTVDVPEPEAAKPKGGGRGGIGSASRARGGIGSASRIDANGDRSSTPSTELKGGIGSSKAAPNPIEEDVPDPEVPSPFGRRPVVTQPPQSSFKGRPTAQTAAKAPKLTANDAAYFRNIESTFGARMLANLGWKAGEGLGVNRDGRAVPIEAGKIMKGKGIQAGVRTEDSKREARRRGELVSDDEDEQPTRRGRRGPQAKPSRARQEPEQSWKKQRKVKVKVEHKTYEQLLAEAGDTSVTGIGLVLDARGGDVGVSNLCNLLTLDYSSKRSNRYLPSPCPIGRQLPTTLSFLNSGIISA